jgi:UDP-N-acetylglucosamine--N-acetylmuramyl-(pentapeptide) pyrophosphoryl-undecaprenol N-acetylglucosamine transferase
MNIAMAANTQIILDNPQLQILWQYGELYKDKYADCATAQLANVKADAFIARMDLAYAMADIIICRAGALTIAELYFAGKPTILIPSPNVAEDHQTKNAMALVADEAAILLKDDEAEAQIMTKAIELLDNEPLKNKLAENLTRRIVRDAGTRIAEEVIKLVEKNTKHATGEHK